MPVLQNLLFYIIPFILVVGVVVTIHELGHFLAARALGTKIDKFSIGFGRTIAGWHDKQGVEWRIGWIPIGGYVRFAGDENAASIPDLDDLAEMRQRLIDEGRAREIPRYFHFKPIWQRAIIIAAGPVSNFLLAMAVFATLYLVLGQPMSIPRVDGVEPGSPAAQAGFQTGDMIRGINGKAIDDWSEITQNVILSSDTAMTFDVERGGRALTLTATPRRGVIYDALGRPQKLGRLGLQHLTRPGDVTIRHYDVPQALTASGQRIVGTIGTTINYVGRLVTGRENAEQLAGPLGMAQLSHDLAKKTAEVSPTVGAFLINLAVGLFELVGVISVGIGFMNLLPVPVLDGGHLLFYAYEAVARRPLAAKVQAAGYRVGLALVLGLMLFATWNDLQRLRVFHLFGGLFS
jgi:regulator of sigma E protease